MFNMDDFEAKKFGSENSIFTKRNFRLTVISNITSPLTETLGVFMIAGLLWFGGRDVLMGKGFTAEDFIRFIAFLFMMFQPIKALGNINNSIQNGLAAAERVFHLIDTPPEDLKTITSQTQIPVFKREIGLTNVRFTYPGTNEEVLHGIDIRVPYGKIVALVGSSGSGKSTILDLLPRFYDITSGSITLDGTDIRDFDLSGLRSMFGIVSQETILFNESVFNNIAYGIKDITKEKVVDVAKAAQAWEFIEKMPQGLDTVIGERGVMLSGGQRQRLSIARALLKNPEILILDEATSSLDTESERLVQGAINKLMENRTAIVVAHRLSTISHADTIIVLENGLITEQGTHEELMKINKRYKYFYDMQFSVPPQTAS
jgi:subfamily B ATP-binding cassette protein MsbA